MYFINIVTFLAICGLTAAGHNHHATSYSVVTKHDDHHNGWHGHGQGWHGHGYGHRSGHGHGSVYGYGSHGAGYYHGGHGHNHYDHHANPSYNFKYAVKNLKTGDIKNQWEHRHGDHVKGSYSLKDSDGTTRVVDYTAGGHHGFNAVVKKIGHAYHPSVNHHHQNHHHGSWNGHYGYHGHHGHATSYVNFKRY